MSAGHGHGTGPHAGGRYRRRLLATFTLVAGFFVIELIAGLASGSLALISDAGHMAADVVALGAALVALRLAVRPDRTGRRTYGSYRIEVFASGFTVLVMLGVGAYVAIEALGRIGEQVRLETGPVLVVGILGLLVNVVSIAALRSGARESLNVRGAYFEVVADAAGSVGVIIAGLLTVVTGDAVWDTVIALAIAVFIVVRALVLARQVLGVLAQQAPADVDVARLRDALSEVAGVGEVHDVHVWELTSGMRVATAHLFVSVADTDSVMRDARAMLRENGGIEHVTLQVERVRTKECSALTW